MAKRRRRRNPIPALFGDSREPIRVLGPTWPGSLVHWDARFQDGELGTVRAYDLYTRRGERWLSPPATTSGPWGLNPPCQVLTIDPEEDWELAEQAEQVFRAASIHLDSNEEVETVCLSPSGKVVGAVAVGLYSASPAEGDPLRRPRYSFSVAVLPEARRQGVGRALVQWLMEAYPRDEFLLEGKVVNPHMGALLSQLGFQHEHGDPDDEWTDHHTRWGRRMYRPNPHLPAPRRPQLPERHSFHALASGDVPLIYVPEGVQAKPQVARALYGMLKSPPLQGLASPDAWDTLLAMAGLAANVYVVDRQGEEWQVLDVDFDPGGRTGRLLVRHQGRRARTGDKWIDLQDAYGYMIPYVKYKEPRSRRNPGGKSWGRWLTGKTVEWLATGMVADLITSNISKLVDPITEKVEKTIVSGASKVFPNPPRRVTPHVSSRPWGVAIFLLDQDALAGTPQDPSQLLAGFSVVSGRHHGARAFKPGLSDELAHFEHDVAIQGAPWALPADQRLYATARRMGLPPAQLEDMLWQAGLAWASGPRQNPCPACLALAAGALSAGYALTKPS